MEDMKLRYYEVFFKIAEARRDAFLRQLQDGTAALTFLLDYFSQILSSLAHHTSRVIYSTQCLVLGILSGAIPVL